MTHLSARWLGLPLAMVAVLGCSSSGTSTDPGISSGLQPSGAAGSGGNAGSGAVTEAPGGSGGSTGKDAGHTSGVVANTNAACALHVDGSCTSNDGKQCCPVKGQACLWNAAQSCKTVVSTTASNGVFACLTTSNPESPELQGCGGVDLEAWFVEDQGPLQLFLRIPMGAFQASQIGTGWSSVDSSTGDAVTSAPDCP